MTTRLSALALVFVLTLNGSALAQDRRDQQLFDAVATTVNRYAQLTIFDSIDASIENGHVVLSGWVTMPFKSTDLERRVARVDGVKSVVNKIEVTPVSQFDDELRFRIARAIYGHSSFWNYAAMANPPIRVVVVRGHVTLTGVVNSNVERVLARSLVVGFPVFSVNNLLKTDAEVRASLERLSN